MLNLASVPDFFPDEDLLGFLHRAAISNVVSPATLLRAFRNASDDDVTRWIMGEGRPMNWLSQSAEIRHPSVRPTKAWCYRYRKFCPYCLEASAYWRGNWSLMLVTCCTRHNCWLQERCSKCGSAATMDAVGQLRCVRCGEWLQAAGACTSSKSAVSEEALWLARELSIRCAQPNARLDEVSTSLTLLDLHELALRLGIRSNALDSKKPLRLRGAGTLAVAIPIAESAAHTLRAWPQGFFSLLDKVREYRAGGAAGRMRSAIGPIYQDIYRYLSAAQFEFVRHAFERYVHDCWEAPIARRNRNLGVEALRRHRWVALPDAATRTGVELALLRRMATSHQIPIREVVGESQRVVRVVDVEAVKDRADGLRRAVTLERASELLGLSEKRVRQLLAAGVLVSFGGAPRAGQRWWIDEASLRRCAMPGRRAIFKSRKSVSIAELAKVRVADDDQFVALIRAMLSGDLAVYVPSDAGNKIGQWLFDEAEFTKWRSLATAPQRLRLSVSAAAAQLGVKQEVAYALVRAGVLPADTASAGRRVARWVDAAALLRFRKQYVFGTELAALAGTTPKQIAQRLRAHGLDPIAGPTGAQAQCRQYLWLRTRSVLALTVNDGRY